MTQEDIIRNCEILQESNSQDPLYRMMFMMMNMLMEMEANKITGSKKGEHNSERTDYRSGTRDRRFDTRLGTFNLKIPKKQKESFGAELKKIWQAETREDAIKQKIAFVEKYADKYEKAIECLEEGFKDSIQYYGFSKIDSRKISSTNTLERLNNEIRRRSLAVGIFPSMESYLRLMTASLIEYSEDHLTGASYISAETLREQKIQ